MISTASEFHQLLDAAPDAMIVVDELGRMTAINLEAERFFGWAEQELLGEPMSRCFPPRFHRLLDTDFETGGASLPGSNTGRTVSCFAERGGGAQVPVAAGPAALRPGERRAVAGDGPRSDPVAPRPGHSLEEHRKRPRHPRIDGGCGDHHRPRRDDQVSQPGRRA